MERRKFSREFKLEAVRLVRDRGVTSAQASRDLGGFMRTFCASGCGSWRRIPPRPFPATGR